MTTTDDFTTAARAAARGRLAWHDMRFGDILRPMVWMAKWARDYLLAQAPSDAEVEAAARAIALDVSYDADPDLAGYRIVARRALSAARTARGGTT